MANKKFKYSDNVPGRFYVDHDCIYCGLCAKIAPSHFCLGKPEDHDIVFKQPATKTEIALCLDALNSCPVEAIGDDEE